MPPIMFNLKIIKTMVAIVDYKSIERESGDKFFVLVVQGGIETAKSKQTGKVYFTTRTTNVPVTFGEDLCKSMIGTQMDGSIKKVNCEPYDYIIKETGEVIQLTYRYEYVDEILEVVSNQVVESVDVI
jgi:hypothetical protein